MAATMRRARTLTAAMATAILATSLTPADARRKATTVERVAILRVVHAKQNACRFYPAGHCSELVRISTVRTSWAAVYVRPSRPAYRHEVQSDVGSLRRVDGKWRLHQIGNGGGCGVPASVRRDLSLECY